MRDDDIASAIAHGEDQYQEFKRLIDNLESIALDNIKLGVHAERSRAIATLLTQLGYMSLRDGSQSAIGTGVPRLILRLSRALSGRTPEFEMVGEELRVRIWARSFP